MNVDLYDDHDLNDYALTNHNYRRYLRSFICHRALAIGNYLYLHGKFWVMKAWILKSTLSCLLLVVFFTACQTDEDITAPRFKATITNATAQNYDLYYKQDFANGIYAKVGALGAGKSLEITNLSSNLSYTVRIVLPNAPYDPAVQEKNFNSAGQDVTVTFN